MYEFCKARLEEIRARSMTKDQVAEWATETTGVRVTSANIASIMGPEDKSMIPFDWGRKRNRRENDRIDTLEHITEVLARSV